jgi:hypothetical protein
LVILIIGVLAMSRSTTQQPNPTLDGHERHATPIAIVDALKTVAGDTLALRDKYGGVGASFSAAAVS